MGTSRADVIIRGGTVIDGSGSPRVRADVVIRGDRIVDLGAGLAADGAREIDARGLVVAPGFIDAHTHDDRAVLATPEMAAKVSQGVTTVIAGNCGISLAPMLAPEPVPPLNLLGRGSDFFTTVAEYVDALRAAPAALNLAAQVGHSSLRVSTMDRLDRPARPGELARMTDMLDEAMEAGCLGLSTGLAYPPANAAPTEEVVALVRRVADHGGLHSSHMRDERAGVVDSVRETIEIGRQAGVPVVISHHKCSGRESWGMSELTLAEIAAAQATAAVDLDVYPYTASSTVLLPDFVRSADRVIVTWSEAHPEQAGRDLADIRAEWQTGVDETIARLLPAGAIYFHMDEGDLERILRFPGTMIGSDGLPHDTVPHPRLWGTFPRVLGHFCRERGWLGLEDAVWRMTGKPAQVFGLAHRGRIAVGGFADLVVFDAATVIDRATYEHPTRAARGIEHVLVNGQEVWTDERSTGVRPGRFLARAEHAH